VLVRRLLQNLISNALRYTQRGGVVVACRPRQGRCVVQVWDTGPGIAEQHRKIIFSEFRGLDRASPWGEKGLGLGLSICDRIARLLGIELTLQSRVGQGSVFAASLPVASMQATPLEDPPSTPGSPAGVVGSTVLCVDNEAEILLGMTVLLQRWGVHVLGAQTAEEARRVFRQHSPDVVIADYRLDEGDCDGLELLQSLLRGGVPAPGALVTADHGSAVAARAKDLGYTVLRKPVKPAALRALLGALLASASHVDTQPAVPCAATATEPLP
jgi:CheY-like chemotaxis protein